MPRPPGRSSSTLTTAPAISAKAISTGPCHPGASASRLNAAPLLKASTRLKKPVTARRSPGAKASRTAHLVTRSAAITAADRPNQRASLDMPARLTRPLQVANAAAAERLLVYVRAVMPATLAFAVCAWLDLHTKLFLAVNDARGRRQHQVLKLVAEA